MTIKMRRNENIDQDYLELSKFLFSTVLSRHGMTLKTRSAAPLKSIVNQHLWEASVVFLYGFANIFFIIRWLHVDETSIREACEIHTCFIIIYYELGYISIHPVSARGTYKQN